MKKGDRILIKDNLEYHMKRLEFDDYDIKNITKKYVGTVQTVYDIWKDADDTFVTIDMCVEIPIESCEVIKK